MEESVSSDEMMQNLSLEQGLFLIQESQPALVVKIQAVMQKSKEEMEKLYLEKAKLEKNVEEIQKLLDEERTKLEYKAKDIQKIFDEEKSTLQYRIDELIEKHIQELMVKKMEIQSKDHELEIKIVELASLTTKLDLFKNDYENIKSEKEVLISKLKEYVSKVHNLDEDVKEKQRIINDLLIKTDEYQRQIKKIKAKCILL